MPKFALSFVLALALAFATAAEAKKKPKSSPDESAGSDSPKGKKDKKGKDAKGKGSSVALDPDAYRKQYLSMKFKAEGETIHLSMPHVEYQNPHYNKLMSEAKPLKDTMLMLVNAELKKDKAGLDALTAPIKLKTNDPIILYVFTGEGSPAQIQAVLKIAAHFKDKLGSHWQDKGSLKESLQDFYHRAIGLNCNGFVGNFATAAGTGQSPRTSISAYAPPARRIKKIAEIQRGDVMVWKNGAHITLIEKNLGGGQFNVVESASENGAEGLGPTKWEIKETGSDVLHATRIGAAGSVRDIYVARLK